MNLHLYLIADILNCQGLARAMTQTGRTKTQEEMGGSEERKKILSLPRRSLVP